jgi:transcriptional regulator GlxA family with amidase domain
MKTTLVSTRKVAVFLFDDVEVLDFAGPFEVFSVAGLRTMSQPPFEVFTVAQKASIRARNGLVISPTYTFETCPQPDILVVPGGGGYHPDGQPFGSRREMHNPILLDWIRQLYPGLELLTSVCTGALILGQAGLLEGLCATTHFMAMNSLRQISPNIEVVEKVRWVDNGKIILSAGVSAGIDMSYHIVEKLFGEAVALEGARYAQYDYWPIV